MKLMSVDRWIDTAVRSTFHGSGFRNLLKHARVRLLTYQLHCPRRAAGDNPENCVAGMQVQTPS
eukprot:1405108-Pleurochrysis_carterae.AAC.4